MKNQFLAGLLVSALFISPALARFSDYDSSSDFNDAIEYVSENEIVEGYDDGTFRENNKINRAEFTKIMVLAGTPEEEIYGENCFPDVTDQWFAEYVCTAKRKGIIKGYDDGTFQPGNFISFVEASKIIYLGFGYEVWEGESYEKWFEPFVYYFSDYYIIPDSITELAQEITRGEMVELIWREREIIQDKSYAYYNGAYLKSMGAYDETPVDPSQYEGTYVYDVVHLPTLTSEYQISDGEQATLTMGEENRTLLNQIFGIFDDDISDNYLATVVFFDDPNEDTVGQVMSSIEWGKFDFIINLDAASEILFTAVHEYAHVLEMNSSQDNDAIYNEADCPGYYDHVCYKEDAYITQFYNQFWAPYPDEHGEDATTRYNEDPNRFYNRYAATTPHEDFSETFAYYVTTSSPTKVSEKWNFFENISYLREEKARMRSEVPELTY